MNLKHENKMNKLKLSTQLAISLTALACGLTLTYIIYLIWKIQA